MKNLNKLAIVVTLAFSLLALSGCNTFKGLGEDFEAMGKSMQKSGD